jgi:hypothetical protein
MDQQYHVQITTQALEGQVSRRALQAIIDASLAQDNLRGLIGHPEYHFDDSCFSEGYTYMEQQRQLAHASLARGQALPAWQAFGRLIHAAQDFYAHSNYVRLWEEQHTDPGSNSEAGDEPPLEDEINPLDDAILHSPALFSGRVYYLRELLSWIPALNRPMLRLMPRDAHAWVNLDSPERGPLFDRAMAAAVKRTRHEFATFQARLSPQQQSLFRDIPTPVA